MIQYTLKCEKEHTFDSWFQSSSAFEKLKASKMVVCSICGSSNIDKAIMAPRVNKNNKITVKKKKHPAEQAIAEIKKHVEENSHYVGKDFAKEARAMHLGDLPERAIYGEAKAEEAKSLIDDGIPVTPLPFTPNRKTN
jgi:hypothetical protein